MVKERPGLVCRVHRHHGSIARASGRLVLHGEAVAHCSEGLPDFHGLLGREGQRTACLYAFDLLHLRATDLRPVELVG